MIPVKWSPHAASLLEEIVLGIATELYPDDGIRWETKFREAGHKPTRTEINYANYTTFSRLASCQTSIGEISMSPGHVRWPYST